MSKPKSIRLEYSGRGFHQDASEAMRGDIVRALIETITNCDDAYKSGPGRIEIEIGKFTSGVGYTVKTRDFATGMSAEDMHKKIATIARRTSGFESGEAVRGNLGRGTKDLAAFGTVQFESIKDDSYARLDIEPTGEALEYASEEATPQVRASLGIPHGNGTVVTIHVQPQHGRGPQYSRLKKELSTHFQLREILANPNREIMLKDVRQGPEAVRLRYEFPKLPKVFEGELKISGYSEAIATLAVYRHPEPHQNSARDSTRPEGILVSGQKAIYENTLFGLQGDPFAGYFSGELKIPYIDRLAREYDDLFDRKRALPADNNMPIITRGRDGLKKDHPFTKAMVDAAEAVLEKLVEAEKQKAAGASGQESRRMQKDLRALGQSLAKALNEDLRDIESDPITGDVPGEEPPPIRLIPGGVLLCVGYERVFTVQVRADLAVSGAKLEVVPEGAVDLPDGNVVVLSPHRSRDDLLVGKFRVVGKTPNQRARITVTVEEYSAVAMVEVVQTIPPPPDELPPETFEFEQPTYRVKPNERRMVCLRAPNAVVEAGGPMFLIESSGEAIVVLDGPRDLVFNPVLGYWTAQIEVEGKLAEGSVTLLAILGNLEATCSAEIAKAGDGQAFKIAIMDQEAGKNRVVVDRPDGGFSLQIMGRHPLNRRYLGEGPDFVGQDLPETRAYLAEIVAQEVVRVYIEKRFGGQQVDAPELFAEYKKAGARYLRACHQVLVPTPTVDSLDRPGVVPDETLAPMASA